jgi:diguanylate cyclase (GGDEF)-like protein
MLKWFPRQADNEGARQEDRLASTWKRASRGAAEPSDAAKPLRDSDSYPADRGPRWTGLPLIAVGAAWGLAVLLAVLDELASVEHGPAVLAWALSLLTGVSLLAYFQARRKVVRAPSRGEASELDPLTGLLIATSFQRRLEERHNRFVLYGDVFSVVLVDMNNLSAINREHGQATGDEVLRHMARCIDKTKRASDVVARVGDDEFGVILQGCDERGADAFVQRLEDRLARESVTVEVEGRSVSVWLGVCAGVAAGGSEGDWRQTLARATVKLDAAKQERDRRRRLWLSAA